MIAVFIVMMFAGCESHNKDDRIWDFVNWDVVLIVDSSRGNLLDPKTEGNILDNDITIDYDRKIYRLNEPRTRETMARWEGLRIGKYYGYQGDNGTPAMLFGEFKTSTKGFHGETFVIDWGDGTHSAVMFDLYITWAWNKKKGYDEPTVHKKIWIDGELKSEDSLMAVIVR